MGAGAFILDGCLVDGVFLGFKPDAKTHTEDNIVRGVRGGHAKNQSRSHIVRGVTHCKVVRVVMCLTVAWAVVLVTESTGMVLEVLDVE